MSWIDPSLITQDEDAWKLLSQATWTILCFEHREKFSIPLKENKKAVL